MKLSLLLLFILSTTIIYAQHAETNDNAHESAQEESLDKFKLLATLGVTHIPAAFEHGHESKEVFVPTIGLDLFYHINHHWSLGIMADLELDEYIVEFNRDDLEREKAFILTLMAGYEVQPHWEVLIGGGIEMEHNKNLGVIRFGTEYSIPFKNNWLIAPSFFFVYKEEYSTWALAIGIGKSF
jgi:hypothetical protein